MFRLRSLALFGAGLLLGTSAGIVSGAIPSGSGVYSACFDKRDGTLHLIDEGVATCAKGQQGPVTWNQVGPQGPAGSPGPAGPQGSPGVLGSLDSIEGLPCTRGASSGDTKLVSNTLTGEAVIACVIGLADGALAPDSWNNTPSTAAALTLTCGTSSQVVGTTVPVGTNDWFKVTYALTATCPSLRIRLVTNPNNWARFDVTDADGVRLNHNDYETSGFEFGATITSPNPVWIRVWSPYIRTNYVLAIDEL